MQLLTYVELRLVNRTRDNLLVQDTSLKDGWQPYTYVMNVHACILIG